MAERVVVGMSGGVDSSLAALLLQEAGHEVVGVTCKLWPCATGAGDDPGDACCSPVDARAVAVGHGIGHYVLDFEDRFRARVIADFVAGYRRGETPNPCVGCNERVKFGDLAAWAEELGASAVGTGHYARTAILDGRRCVATAADPGKDQSYFLFTLSQDQLAAARFPLGELDKTAVRAEARRRGLPNAEREESMDLCFVGEDGVRGFLRREVPEAFAPGPIELADGTPLGEHAGLPGITVGQRKGLGVAWREPLYVLALDPLRNAVVMGPRSELQVGEAWLRDCHWQAFLELPALGLSCRVRNRHRAAPVEAVIKAAELPDGRPGARVRYRHPVPRPAPGQACVAYDAALRHVLGGGWFVDPCAS